MEVRKYTKVAGETRDQLEQLIRAGRSDREIVAATGMSKSSVTKWRSRLISQSPSILEVPRRIDQPSDGDARVALEMDHEQFVQLGGEPVVVAGMIAADSLKQRLLKAIALEGPFAELVDLIKTVRTGPRDTFGNHEVMHILFGANQQGLIQFRVSGTGSQQKLRRIEARESLFKQMGIDPRANRAVGRAPAWKSRDELPQRAGDRTDFRTHGPRAEGGPIEHVQGLPGSGEVVPSPLWDGGPTVRRIIEERDERLARAEAQAEVTPARIDEEPPVDTRWPQLSRIQAKAEAHRSAKARAEKLLEAAALLESVDARESSRLEGLANDAGSENALTPLEAEYLSFAEKKGVD